MAALPRHPWLLEVLASTRPPLNAAVQRAIDRPMATLTDQGLHPETALSAYLLISGYVQGAALLPTAEQRAVHGGDAAGRRFWARRSGELAGAVESGRFPWLTALAATPAAAGPTDADLDAWFDFGLGLGRVLDGVDVFIAGHRHPSEQTPRPPASAGEDRPDAGGDHPPGWGAAARSQRTWHHTAWPRGSGGAVEPHAPPHSA